jgi:hypothetical protein
MSVLDVNVTAKPVDAPQRLQFTFTPRYPSKTTADYLAADGSIDVPQGSGALTIQFHLLTSSVNLGGSTAATSLNFDSGTPLNGKRILKIWRDGDSKTTTKWPAAFNAPATSPDHRTVSVSDDNLISANYHYRLAVGARTGEKVELIEVDPIIKNGGSRANWYDDGLILALATAIVGAIVGAGIVGLLWRWRR